MKTIQTILVATLIVLLSGCVQKRKPEKSGFVPVYTKERLFQVNRSKLNIKLANILDQSELNVKLRKGSEGKVLNFRVEIKNESAKQVTVPAPIYPYAILQCQRKVKYRKPPLSQPIPRSCESGDNFDNIKLKLEPGWRLVAENLFVEDFGTYRTSDFKKGVVYRFKLFFVDRYDEKKDYKEPYDLWQGLVISPNLEFVNTFENQEKTNLDSHSRRVILTVFDDKGQMRRKAILGNGYADYEYPEKGGVRFK